MLLGSVQTYSKFLFQAFQRLAEVRHNQLRHLCSVGESVSKANAELVRAQYSSAELEKHLVHFIVVDDQVKKQPHLHDNVLT